MTSDISFADVVDVDNGFEERTLPVSKPDVATRLKAAIQNADEVYLATDGDREGEAIAWHLIEEFGLRNSRRTVFRELTKSGVLNGIEHSGALDKSLVDAARARSVLDYLLGMNISRLLWPFGCKSAGRLQSCALRILVDRERMIQAFVPRKFWTVIADYREGFSASPVVSELDEETGESRLVPRRFDDSKEAEAIAAACRSATHRVESIATSSIERQPPKPFITSTMLSTASTKLGFSVKHTTALAQELFEKGLITYLRTDSAVMAVEGQQMIREYLTKTNPVLVPPKPPKVTNAAGAQAAHEAIRPTAMDVHPAGFEDDGFRLYELIFRRALVSQCAPAVFSRTTVTIAPGEHAWRLKAQVTTVQRPGWLSLEGEGEGGQALPALREGQVLNLLGARTKEGQTKRPARFTEASLIQYLEKRQIGRPSTYSAMISTLLDRNYVGEEGKFLRPEPTGFTADELVRLGFNELSEEDFTAQTEKALDGIAAREVSRSQFLRSFYSRFCELEAEAEVKFAKYAADHPNAVPQRKDAGLKSAKQPCPKCGAGVVAQPYKDKKTGKPKKFWRCGKCDWTSSFAPPKVSKQPCPECGGRMAERQSKDGDKFWGCVDFPECRGSMKKARRTRGRA